MNRDSVTASDPRQHARVVTPDLDLLSSATALGSTADPQVYLRGGCQKDVIIHEIVDYIHLVPPIGEEQVVSDNGTAQFVLRSAAKKPKLHSVSVEEWALANTRIMDILSRSAADKGVLRDYMAYTMKVCELYKCYERTTVLQYDREYRHLQARYGFRWGTDTPHLHTLHLRLKSTLPAGAGAAVGSAHRIGGQHGQGQRQRRPADGQSPVCFQYNSRDGCSYGAACKFRHVCSESGCGEPHPKVRHSTAPATGGR